MMRFRDLKGRLKPLINKNPSKACMFWFVRIFFCFYNVSIWAVCTNDMSSLTHAQYGETLEIAQEIRCPVCQGESVSESRDPLAQQILCDIARAVKKGQSKKNIQDHLVAQYGRRIHFTPSLNQDTWVLWAFPWFFLGMGCLVFLWTLRKKTRGSCRG